MTATSEEWVAVKIRKRKDGFKGNFTGNIREKKS